MQEYYNIIPTYGYGGLIKIGEKLGSAGLQRMANVVSKENPVLSRLLSKFAKSKKGGEELTEKEMDYLVYHAQKYRRGTYPNRLAKARERLKDIKAKEKASLNSEPTQPKPTQQPKPQTKVEQKPNQPQAEPTQPKPTQQRSNTKQPSNKKKPNKAKVTTLSARWKKAKEWMNNHPKTTIGVPLIALGTGPGRYVTGNVLKATQSNPATWFGEEPTNTEAQDFIMVNGTKLPIKRSPEGYFVPVEQEAQSSNESQQTDIDQILAGITNANLGVTPQQEQTAPPIINQQAINDLFDDDQWQ